MKKFLKFLLLLIVLAGLGLAGWYYFKNPEEVPIIKSRFPKQIPELADGITIGDNGILQISAQNRRDLFFVQGLLHGEKRKDLVPLRDLFKGSSAVALPAEFRKLGELFYCLDLEFLARECLELYPPTLKLMLESYAAGLSRSTQTPWTVTDVLVMQRGYAFLLGQNLAREWAANQLLQKFGLQVFNSISPWPEGGLGGIDAQVLLSRNLDGLFNAPLLETVRFSGSDGWGLQTRAHPFFAFVFVPMALESADGLKARGLTLAGVPFIWSGSNDKILFHLQATLANDDQFYQVPGSLFVGRERDLFRNEAAPFASQYAYAPVHTEYGRGITSLTSGAQGIEYYYYWHGLRPSADLAARYYLMEARTLGEAQAAWQYHQVPSGQLVFRAEGRDLIMESLSDNPNNNNLRLTRTGSLFQKPYLRRGLSMAGILGFDFEIPNLRPGIEASDSQVDQDLAGLLSFYLQGPLLAGSLTEEVRAELAETLLRPSLKRDYLVQLIWHELIRALSEQYFPDDSWDYLVRISDLPLKRFILLSLGNRDDNGSWRAAPVESRLQLIQAVLKKAAIRQKKAATELSPWPFLPALRATDESPFYTEAFGISRDSVNEAFWVAEGNRISQGATHSFFWNDQFSVYVYGLGKSKTPAAVTESLRLDAPEGKTFRIDP